MAKPKPTQEGGGVLPGTTQQITNAQLAARQQAAWAAGNAGGGNSAGYIPTAADPAPVDAPAAPKPSVIGDPWSMTRPTNTPATPDAFAEYLAGMQAQQRQAASAWLQQVLKSYGMDSMAGDVDSLVQAWGNNTDVIALKLRDTQGYKDRFKGLIALQAKGVTDVTNEAQYLQLESQYRQAFRENGLSDFLGAAGSKGERDSIADLVGKFSLSVNEVRDRISDAQRTVAQDTPQEVKDAWATYYGVDTNQLVKYVLDPSKTAEQINRQANAAMAGGIASRAGLNVGVDTASSIADLYGTGDLAAGQVGQQVQNAVTVADATKRLAAIDNIDLSNDEIVSDTFGTSAEAGKKVSGLQSRERARFGGSGAFRRGSLGRGSGN